MPADPERFPSLVILGVAVTLVLVSGAPVSASGQPSATTVQPVENGTTQPSANGTTQPSANGTTDAPIVVSDVTAPERVRRGENVSVTATVTNRGNVTGTESIEYVFDGTAVAVRNVTVDAGETRTTAFDVRFASLRSTNESVAVGTYVHGVRNESGTGVARYLRVTPDVDLAVSGFGAPAEITRNRSFVVLATLSNPANTTITRRVTYRFDGANVTTKTVTVADDEEERVAFAVTVSALEAAGATLREGTTYDHAVVADGGRDGDAVRFVGEPTGDASALVTEAFNGPDDVRRGETYVANVTVRNVDTVAFDGRLTYRLDGAVVATERASVPPGERETVVFRISYEQVERAAFPLSAHRTDQSVWVANESIVSRPVTVEDGVETPTATPTPTPAFTPTATPTPTLTPTATPAPTCQRGFFTRCGDTPLDQTTLTIIGTITSILAILVELFRGE
ncbi:PH domain-containing protein [Haloplanus sp. GCM10025708]|uniref:PH domain-containing protein n=1 Tax=Haloplanus sp. GCM10025708 TaxID=3252679 RepID=UPI003618AEF3